MSKRHKSSRRAPKVRRRRVEVMGAVVPQGDGEAMATAPRSPPHRSLRSTALARNTSHQSPITSRLPDSSSTELGSPRMDSEVDLVRLVLLIVHATLAAFLLGGALYSIMTVQPRARAFFKDVRDFEGFVANLAHGARWQFLPVLLLIGVTGLIDAWFAPHPFLWWICFGLKSLFWTAALGCFVYVSWYLWPRRIVAASHELPAIHRAFAVAARTILTLLGASFVLGVVMIRIR
jgi:hypothetical protein